jgi:hypothetical protein
MIRTIVIGSATLVQGIFIRSLGDGRIAVRVGKDTFVGAPV